MKFEMLPDQIQLEAARCLREYVICQSGGERDQAMQLASVIRDAFCELYQKGDSSGSKSTGGNADNDLK
ncbi:Uncharacterised protein [Providencia stuartii]|nr:Uncharacterised protein [Providencia stuartii]SPY68542.1 Uncharacterised protein [Providencia stuartii]